MYFIAIRLYITLMKTEIQKFIEERDFTVTVDDALESLITHVINNKVKMSLCENGIERGHKLAKELTDRDFPTFCLMGGLWQINKILSSPNEKSEILKLNRLLSLFPSIICVIPDRACFQGYPLAYDYLKRKVPNFTCHDDSTTALFSVIYRSERKSKLG